MKTLKRLAEKLLIVELALGGILLFVILLVVFLATVGRYTTWFRITFSEEIARFCMIWLVFIGAAVSAHRQELFNVDLIKPRLSPVGQYIFISIRAVLTLIFCAFAIKYGISMVQRQLILGQKSAMLGIPYAFMYSSVPVGCTLMIIHYFIRTILDIEEIKSLGN